MRDLLSQNGYAPGALGQFFDSRIPWTRPGFKARNSDKRFFPAEGVGRRLCHPYLEDILYPEQPSRTTGFDYSPLRTVKSVLTRTEGGTALVQYVDYPDDVVITETFDGSGELKVSIEFVRLLLEYLLTPLPVGSVIGWHCPDLSPYFYAVEIIDIKIGSSDQYHLDEIGSEEPYMLVEPLQVIFKTVTEAKPPVGSLVFSGH